MKIPVYKIRIPITGSELVLNIGGDFHYGADGAPAQGDLINALNGAVSKYKGNIFRILTGDLIENALKSSVGHNYDVNLADPAVQKEHMVKILEETNKFLYDKDFNKLSMKDLDSIRCVACDGNHEYRSRKLSGQWLTKEMCKDSKTFYLGMEAIIELTIYNKRIKGLERTYKIFVAHRPSSSVGTSHEAMMRAFRKKQGSLPGIDIIAFGHLHRKFIDSSSYVDTKTGEIKKVLYVVNPSPMNGAEYASEAGYAPLEAGYYVNINLPLDPNSQMWGII